MKLRALRREMPISAAGGVLEFVQCHKERGDAVH
jgi:hypothetical protein